MSDPEKRAAWLALNNKSERDVLTDEFGNQYIHDHELRRVYLPDEFQLPDNK